MCHPSTYDPLKYVEMVIETDKVNDRGEKEVIVLDNDIQIVAVHKYIQKYVNHSSYDQTLKLKYRLIKDRSYQYKPEGDTNHDELDVETTPKQVATSDQ